MLAVAKDQNGCRFLQRKFDEGGASAIAKVFPEILDNLIELMTDPFGNYLTQKLLDRCSEEQRLDVSLGRAPLLRFDPACTLRVGLLTNHKRYFIGLGSYQHFAVWALVRLQIREGPVLNSSLLL